MKKERRTKNEMQQMESDIRYYLMYNSYDAHKAYDNFIKDHLLAGRPTPHYIKGIKDFIKMSEIMKIEREQKELEKQYKIESEKKKINYIEQLKQITQEKYKIDILPIFHNLKDNNKKMALVSLWYAITANEYKFNNSEIDTYKNLGILQ